MFYTLYTVVVVVVVCSLQCYNERLPSVNYGGAGIVDSWACPILGLFIVQSMDFQLVENVWMAAGERSLVEEGGRVAVGGGGRTDARRQ